MTGLARVVSRWEIVALAINDVVGSGVYVVLPVAAAALLGPTSIGAIFAAGLAVALLVACFAEAASRFDRTGGAYVYARAAFGELAGFEVGWMTWTAKVATVSSLAAYFARTVSFFVPAGARGQSLIAVATLALLAALNVRGVKSGARAAVILTWGKLLPLALFVIVGLVHLAPARLAFTPPAPGHLGKAALLVLFAYSGFENTPALAGEHKDPRRDVPFALAAMIVLVTGLYTLVQVVAVGAIGELGASATPLAAAMRGWIGPVGGVVMTVGAGLSVLGTLNNTVLVGPRYVYALASDGMLPAPLARLHPRFQTPWLAIVVQATIAALLLLTGTAEQLAEMSVVARLVTYTSTAAAVPVLRRKAAGSDAKALRLPFGPAIPLAALSICAVFLSSATLRNLLAGGLALGIGAGVFALARRRRAT